MPCKWGGPSDVLSYLGASSLPWKDLLILHVYLKEDFAAWILSLNLLVKMLMILFYFVFSLLMSSLKLGFSTFQVFCPHSILLEEGFFFLYFLIWNHLERNQSYCTWTKRHLLGGNGGFPLVYLTLRFSFYMMRTPATGCC